MTKEEIKKQKEAEKQETDKRLCAFWDRLKAKKII